MNSRKLGGIAFFAFFAFAFVASGATDITVGENDYCERYNIEFWCEKGATDFLEGLDQETLEWSGGYLNDLAFTDSQRYTGLLKVDSVKVISDVGNDGARVNATYIIKNPGDEVISDWGAAFYAPGDTKLYLDGEELEGIDAQLDGWPINLGPGETQVVKLVMQEPNYGDIYAYNINLLFDGKTIDNHISPKGSFEFLLPVGVDNIECVPGDYTKSVSDGRTKVTWEMENFVPWTNPFNDLICKWDGAGTETKEEPTTTQSPQNTTEGSFPLWIIILVVAIILVAVFYFYKRGQAE